MIQCYDSTNYAEPEQMGTFYESPQVQVETTSSKNLHEKSRDKKLLWKLN